MTKEKLRNKGILVYLCSKLSTDKHRNETNDTRYLSFVGLRTSDTIMMFCKYEVPKFIKSKR